MRVIARCVHGLEWVCADEVDSVFGPVAAAAGGIGLDRREITFSAPELTAGLLDLRTVDDVFVEVGRFGGVGTTKAALPGLARGLRELPWDDVAEQIRHLRPLGRRPLIDVVASIEGRRSYNRFLLEQAAGEAISAHLAGHYLRRTPDGREPGEAELTLRLFLRADELTAALRVGLAPVHRRAYKQETGPGTLHPPAAAAMARLAALERLERLERLDRRAVVLDPFCGDGTIAIESALAQPGSRVFGRDADPERVAHSIRNAARAGIGADIARADAGSLIFTGADALITNPPWNLAVDAVGSLTGSLEHFWQRVPDLLGPNGRLMIVGDATLALPETLRAHDFEIGLVAPLRLAGRICHVVLAAPPGAPVPAIAGRMLRWRERALEAGVITPAGW